jgi:transposase
MSKLEFSTEEVEALRYWRFHHPHPHVQLKMEVVYLRSQKLGNKQIQQLCGISKATFYRYLHAYQEGGVEKLQELNFHRQQSQLVEHKTTLEEYFRAHPPATSAEAAARIEELSGIKRGPTQTREFLKELGMKPRKVGQIPAKADVKEQEGFKEEKLEPRLEEARVGKRLVFFMDGAFCLCAVSRFSLVLRATVCEGPQWAPAIERAGGLECHDQGGLHRPEPNLCHGRDGL